MKVNDTVRILSEKKGSINEKARVEKIELYGVRVTNMNMPFSGTFVYKFFTFSEVEVV